MKTFTSASANKFIRRLEDEKYLLLHRESESNTYTVTQNEEPEDTEYDYADTRMQVAVIDGKICKIRHALHAFNLQTTLPESDLTIDEALIVIAQLSAEQRRLDTMRTRRQRRRLSTTGYLEDGTPTIEYEYANYDVEQAKRDYEDLTDRIYDLQLKLDLCNQTLTFEVDI